MAALMVKILSLNIPFLKLVFVFLCVGQIQTAILMWLVQTQAEILGVIF
jgi:hypothetical protein